MLQWDVLKICANKYSGFKEAVQLLKIWANRDVLNLD